MSHLNRALKFRQNYYFLSLFLFHNLFISYPAVVEGRMMHPQPPWPAVPSYLMAPPQTSQTPSSSRKARSHFTGVCAHVDTAFGLLQGKIFAALSTLYSALALSTAKGLGSRKEFAHTQQLWSTAPWSWAYRLHNYDTAVFHHKNPPNQACLVVKSFARLEVTHRNSPVREKSCLTLSCKHSFGHLGKVRQGAVGLFI